jgi:type IV secretory pathway VirB3-like protein
MSLDTSRATGQGSGVDLQLCNLICIDLLISRVIVAIAAALFLAAAFLLVTRLTCWRNYLFRRRLEARPTSLTFCWRNCLYRRRLEARSTSLTFWKRCRREIGGSAGACSCFMLPRSVRLWGR